MTPITESLSKSLWDQSSVGKKVEHLPQKLWILPHYQVIKWSIIIKQIHKSIRCIQVQKTASRKFRSIAAKDMRRSKARGTVGPGDWIRNKSRGTRNVKKNHQHPYDMLIGLYLFWAFASKWRNVGTTWEPHGTTWDRCWVFIIMYPS